MIGRSQGQLFVSWSLHALCCFLRQETLLRPLYLSCPGCQNKYHKIPMISPGLIFLQKAFLLGLFLGELICGLAYYWKEFCISKLVGSDNKNSIKHYENSLKTLKTSNPNSPWAYIQEGLLSNGFLHLRFWGLIFGTTYLFLGGGSCYRNFTVT